MELGGPVDFDLVDETSEEKIQRLEQELAEAKVAAKLNWDALRELMRICKERSFDPFPGENLEPRKPPSEMTRDELIARNAEATVRIEKNKRAPAVDKIPMPTYEEEMKLYQEDPQIKSLTNLMETMRKVPPEPIKKSLVDRILDLFRSKDDDDSGLFGGQD